MAEVILNSDDSNEGEIQGLNTRNDVELQQPIAATPEERRDSGGGAENADISDREAAAAAAEVSVMGQASRVQRNDASGEEAMIGATADGVGAFEMVDEVGELVKDRFLHFLME